MIKIYKDKFGYYFAQIFNDSDERYLGCTFSYLDRGVCEREALALQRIYQNSENAKEERKAPIKVAPKH